MYMPRTAHTPPKPSVDDEADLDALLDSALDAFDEKEEEQAQSRNKPQRTTRQRGSPLSSGAAGQQCPPLPTEEEMLQVVTTLFERMMQNPDYDPGLSDEEERKLEQLVQRGLDHAGDVDPTRTSPPVLSETFDESTLSESVQLLRNILEKEHPEEGKPRKEEPSVDGDRDERSESEPMQKIHALLSELAKLAQETPTNDGSATEQSSLANAALEKAAPEILSQATMRLLAQTLNPEGKMEESSGSISAPFHLLRRAHDAWKSSVSDSATAEERARMRRHEEIVIQLCAVCDSHVGLGARGAWSKEHHEAMKENGSTSGGEGGEQECSFTTQLEAMDAIHTIVNLLDALQSVGTLPETFLKTLEEHQLNQRGS